MPRFVFALALAAFALWSLFGLIAWGVVSLGGDLLRAASPLIFFGHPDATAIADSASRVLTAMGSGVVAFVWLAGSAVLLIGTLMLRTLSGSATINVRHFEFRQAARPMKDVTPPRGREPDDRPRLPPPDERRD